MAVLEGFNYNYAGTGFTSYHYITSLDTELKFYIEKNICIKMLVIWD